MKQVTQKESSKPIIIREDKETKETQILSFADAKKTLSNYWKSKDIEKMLDKGQKLHTPYATYSKEIIARTNNC
ncbi:MAG: hypothetical protein ACOYKI_03495 [Sediminibacterium sp.]